MIIGQPTVTAALAAGVAASGTLVAAPEAGASAAPPPLGWNCKAHKDTTDDDPGGSSGWTRRRWKFSKSNVAEARFAAKSERFGVYNGKRHRLSPGLGTRLLIDRPEISLSLGTTSAGPGCAGIFTVPRGPAGIARGMLP